jgi:membrane-bound lytic murein transglycosylase B
LPQKTLAPDPTAPRPGGNWWENAFTGGAANLLGITVRWLTVLVFVLALASTPAGAPRQDQPPVIDVPQPFADWLATLRQEAQDRGFSDALLGETLADLEPLERVVQADRSQAELNPGFARYLSTRLTPAMIGRGKEMAKEHRAILGQVERKFDVQSRFLLAIWGMETRYGRVTGNTPVFQALATLAWEPRRAGYFRGELFNALTMVQRGHIDARSMTGSWAGAMGQTQFMPSSYLSYAVDFDGDGRRDIWKSTGDTLASIANYLKGFRWNGDETWGREVTVSDKLREEIARTIPRRTQGCFAVRNMTERRPLEEWQKIGVRLPGGKALPRADLSAGLVDVGQRTFLVYPNYDAILGYNCAHYYALTVALLSDRLR